MFKIFAEFLSSSDPNTLKLWYQVLSRNKILNFCECNQFRWSWKLNKFVLRDSIAWLLWHYESLVNLLFVLNVKWVTWVRRASSETQYCQWREWERVFRSLEKLHSILWVWYNFKFNSKLYVLSGWLVTLLTLFAFLIRSVLPLRVTLECCHKVEIYDFLLDLLCQLCLLPTVADNYTILFSPLLIRPQNTLKCAF